MGSWSFYFCLYVGQNKDENCLTIQLFPTVSIAFQSLFTSRGPIYGRSHALFRTHA